VAAKVPQEPMTCKYEVKWGELMCSKGPESVTARSTGRLLPQRSAAVSVQRSVAPELGGLPLKTISTGEGESLLTDPCCG